MKKKKIKKKDFGNKYRKDKTKFRRLKVSKVERVSSPKPTITYLICNFFGWFALKGVFARLYFFFTDSDSPWWANSDYMLYIAFWNSLRGSILALKLMIGLNFDFFGNSNLVIFSVISFIGKSTSLIMKMILVFYQNISFDFYSHFKGSY